MFEPAAPYDSHEPPQVPYSKERYQLYRGEPASGIQMKVRLVYLEPVYFEIVQPIGDASSPWHDHFKKYGTSVCFISFYIEGFKQHIDFMNKQGFPLIFEEHYTARNTGTTGLVAAIAAQSEPAIYDAFDCPHCGCQNITQERKRNSVEAYTEEDPDEEAANLSEYDE
jgi:hypothetical protein